MYEMQRPRPVSRCRPADFSASFAPLDHLPGPATLPVFRLPRSPAGVWDSPGPGGPGITLHQGLWVSPKPSGSKYFLRRGSELSFRRLTRGFPQGQEASSFPFAEVAQSFLFAVWLGVSPPPVGSKFSLCRWLGGCPPCRVAPGSPLARGLEITHCRVARGFPRAGRLRVSSSPVAPGSSLPEGPDLPFAGWLGVSPFAGYRPGGRRISTPIGGDRTRGFGQQFQDSLAVHKPSTVDPQLSPATGLSPPNTPQDDPQGGVLTGRRTGQPSAG
jgi:hypothetical protein